MKRRNDYKNWGGGYSGIDLMTLYNLRLRNTISCQRKFDCLNLVDQTLFDLPEKRTTTEIVKIEYLSLIF